MGMDMTTEMFKEEGWIRKKCKVCGKPFWTLDPDRETCGDPPCDEYSFIGKPGIPRKYTLDEMREAFLSFFEKHGHGRVKRYPVLPRWRDDVLLVGASIMDFQPWVISGEADPPANPLTISQPSIRFTDIDNVGITGRHFTIFEMMAHHAFNYPGKPVYWMDETVRLAFEFFTKKLGMKAEDITFKENPWAGGGNAGPAFEVLYRGLEVATLVFMQYKKAPENADPGQVVVIKGDRYVPMETKVVDTGYGLERLVWMSQGGTPTAYDAVLGYVVEPLKREAGGVERIDDRILMENSRLAGMFDIEDMGDLKVLRREVANRIGITVEELEKAVRPYELIYAIADHTKALTFMLADGGVIPPSNVKAGYLARLLIRKSIRHLRELGLEMPLSEIVAMHIKALHNTYPEFKEMEDVILDIINVEEKRYAETLRRGSDLVRREIVRLKKAGKNEIPLEKLILFYESHGLTPEIVAEVAGKEGVKVEVPDNFYTLVAKEAEKGSKGEAAKYIVDFELVKDIPDTRTLYYEDPFMKEFDARVLRVIDDWVVLDATAFYPEGGGQPADLGELNGVKVLDVQKVGKVILHRVEKPEAFAEGQEVHGRIDWNRRIQHMRHHTGTHVLMGALVRVLGKHVWQAGSQLSTDWARLDISHYKRISEEELREIERLANRVVMENREVTWEWLPRTEAEMRYGFRLYQGGVVPGRVIRVLKIKDWDVQACGGTHLPNTGLVGPIKILRTERIQDGVERIIFAAGEAAVNWMQETERILKRTSEVFRVPPEKVPETAERFFNEWKGAKKEVEKLRKELARLLVYELESKVEKVGEVEFIGEVVEGTMEDLREAANRLRKDKRVIVLVTREGHFVVAVGDGLDLKAGELARVVTGVAGGGGGGRKELAQGRIKNPLKAEEAIAEVKKRLG